jgi:hypothetical protein
MEPKMKNADTPFVVLATADSDLGVSPAHQAWSTARDYADKHRVRVTVRDPVTDELIDTVKPR